MEWHQTIDWILAWFVKTHHFLLRWGWWTVVSDTIYNTILCSTLFLAFFKPFSPFSFFISLYPKFLSYFQLQEGKKRIAELIKQNEELFKCSIHAVTLPTCSFEACVLKSYWKRKIEVDDQLVVSSDDSDEIPNNPNGKGKICKRNNLVTTRWFLQTKNLRQLPKYKLQNGLVVQIKWPQVIIRISNFMIFN